MVTISENFTPLASLVGGLAIGGAATLHLATNGRVTGISGIVAGVLRRGEVKGRGWRLAFLGGLGISAAAVAVIQPEAFGTPTSAGVLLPVCAGVLVGIGTQLGSGCTSGHGVCGLARLSLRSLAAVSTFMATGAFSAAATRNLSTATAATATVATAATATATGALSAAATATATAATGALSAVANALGPLLPAPGGVADSKGLLYWAAAAAVLVPAALALPTARQWWASQGTTKGAEAGGGSSTGADGEGDVSKKAARQQTSTSGGPVVAAGLSGLLFGGGLAVSGMLDPTKVVSFLDLTHPWDPSLAFVMGGAVLVTLPAFQLIPRRRAPLLEACFDLPTKKEITAELLAGAALFGAGWGLAGYCPGPALMSVASGQAQAIAFLVAYLLTTHIYVNYKPFYSAKVGK